MRMGENRKKITPADKKLLKFLIEDYLEVDEEELKARIEDNEKIDYYWKELLPFLERDTFRQEHPDQEDIDNSNKSEVILEHHKVLKSLWDQFKISLIDHRDKFTPERNKYRDNMALIEQTDSEKISEYKEFRWFYFT